MQCSYFSTQESGPDEDHQVRSPKCHKVLDEEDLSTGLNRGIYGVEKSKQLIEEFIENIPMLVRGDGTYGLIWNKSLQPSDGRYEPGEHYCRTREPERKSTNGIVSFYRDGETGLKFAIKTLQDSDHFHPWEIKISLVCSSPYLCAVYGVIIRDHKIHILLEHAGSNLNKERSWIAESPERILTFAKQSFEALEDLHGYGYVHCDIKPDNIMIARDQAGSFRVKIIDFGSCQPKGGMLPPDTHTTQFYWSPEIWQSLNNGEHVICQPAMDVYALALTLYFVQTASHLMNMLQERDILPLMTQRSEDLLLIALPETIPSGLRAVMRPCLAGRAEDRWSAQRAANQLDGDAMMQKALSNPRGENYKDLFQQLLRNQLEKSSSQSSETFATQSPNLLLTNNSNSPSIKNDEHKKNENQSSIHYFLGNNQGIEKRDMGLHIKPVGIKTGTDKKQIQTLRVKRPGSLNNSCRSKPKKVLLKGQSKHLKQIHGLNSISPHSCAQDDHEVQYISSDETMPIKASLSNQELKGETVEKPLSAESNQSMVNIFDENSKREIAQVDAKGKQEINSKQYQSFFSPNASGKLGSQRMDKQKPVTLTSPDSDEQAFSCSALLITLASQARSSNEGQNFGHATLPASSPNSKMSQIVERDKGGKKPTCLYSKSDTKPSNIRICHSDMSDHLLCGIKETSLSRSNVQHVPENSHNAALTGGKQKAVAKIFREKLNTTGNQASLGHPATPMKPVVAHQENEDDMDFVYEALKIPQFTGQAEDILDRLCNMLDKDESKTDTNVKKSVHLMKFRESKHSQYGEEEPMDTCEESLKELADHNTYLPFQREKSRKRILDHSDSNIPTKVQKGHPQSDTPITDNLLPIFEEILPENIS